MYFSFIDYDDRTDKYLTRLKILTVKQMSFVFYVKYIKTATFRKRNAKNEVCLILTSDILRKHQRGLSGNFID